LHFMAYGHYNGKKINDPQIRAMFTREALINSKWYKARLVKKQTREIGFWKKNVDYLESFMRRPGYDNEAKRLNIEEKLEQAKAELKYVASDEYVQSLVGTLGADPIHDGYVMADNGADIQA